MSLAPQASPAQQCAVILYISTKQHSVGLWRRNAPAKGRTLSDALGVPSHADHSFSPSQPKKVV